MFAFIRRQITAIKIGGMPIIKNKILVLIRFIIKVILSSPFYVLGSIIVLFIRLISPIFIIRIGKLSSSRIGHLAAASELYLCERDANINTCQRPYIDIFYIAYRPLSNIQLSIMIKRVLNVWPAAIVAPVDKINSMLPGGELHRLTQSTHFDRDIYNLLDKYPAHLKFTRYEEQFGKDGLKAIGIPDGSKYVCLIVRDPAYLSALNPSANFDYHNYRDSDINNFVLAAEALTEKGLYVIRMGAKVSSTMQSKHNMIIDYASNGMRTDFMDIYLGAKCMFCITTGLGWDTIPVIFRRPIVYVNIMPLGYLHTFSKKYISITKKHILKRTGAELTLTEIFSFGLGLATSTIDYESKGVMLIENSPSEILDVVLEMYERINETWLSNDEDEYLQNLFWSTFPKSIKSPHNHKQLHGKIYSYYGASFLRCNKAWIK